MLPFILSILASILATGIGAAGVWLYNYKKQSDADANQIDRITNDISAVKDQMTNGFERIALEKEAVLNAFNTAKIEMEQTIDASNLKQREFYQDIIERIHAETLAREAFSRTVKTSIDTVEQAVANNSESITKLEKQVETLTSEIETLKQPRIVNP